MPSAKDLGGQRFGRWLVLHRGERRKAGPTWVCECDCGTARTLQGQSLVRGTSKSCGCLQRELLQHRYWINGGSGWAKTSWAKTSWAKTSKAGAQQKNDPKGADAPVMASTNGAERSLSALRVQQHAKWYSDRAYRHYSPAALAAGALDAELREILRREVGPELVEVEFSRVIQMVRRG
jgi:hypothetical protein